MEGIMAQVNELYDTLVAKNKSTDARDSKLKLQAEGQEKTAEAQAEKDAELKEREAKTEKVENVLAIEQSNKNTLNEIAQEKESLAEKARAHKEQVAKDTAEIEAREQGIKGDFATLKEREAKLAEDQKKLKEDRENMKKQVIEEIAKGIK